MTRTKDSGETLLGRARRGRSVTREDVAQATQVYADLYGDHQGSNTEWLAALRPLTDPGLFTGLSQADRGNVPQGPAHDVQVVLMAQTFGQGRATFSDDVRLTLSFRLVGSDWICEDIELGG